MKRKFLALAQIALVAMFAFVLANTYKLNLPVTIVAAFITALAFGARKGLVFDGVLAPELQKALREMTDKLTGELNKKAQAEVAEQMKTLNEQLEVLKKSFGEAGEVSLQVKALETALNANQNAFDQLIAAQQRAGQAGEQKTITLGGLIRKGFDAAADEIKGILANGGKQNGPLVINLKAAVTMGMDNTIDAPGSASHYTLTSNTGIVSAIRKRILKYLNYVNVGTLPVEKPYAMWIEELDEQGNPIFIGEGDDKIQLSVRYEEREQKAKKIAVYGKVTTEMMRYLPQLIMYIQGNLIRRMDQKTEDQLFNGDGVGDNLSGIIGYATEFDGGAGVAGSEGLAGKVVDPSIFDVFRAIALQVENSYGVATVVYVKPDILAQMDVAKDSEGRYLMPPFKSASGNIVAGIELVSTNALSALDDVDFVGGDLSVVYVQFLNQSSIQIGLDGNDFTKNKKTILVEQELVQFVSANDTQVLVKGTVADALALLAANQVPVA